MRKLIIIGLLLALAGWLALMPALVGIYLRDAVPDWLAEWSEPEEAGYRPGWFGSRLQWQPENDLDLNLKARHFPPLKPGWLALEGKLDSPLTPQGAELRGHLGLTGSWHLGAAAEQFRPLQDEALLVHRLSLNLSQVAGQPLSLVVNAERLDLPDQPSPLLDLRLRGLRREAGDDRIRLGLDLNVRDPELGTATLVLQAGPIDPARLELLMQGLGQLAESAPGSMAEGMALVTVAGAWQEMAADGLVIELERLQFGDETRFQGVWDADQPAPAATGSGDLDQLENWLARLAPQTLNGDSRASDELVETLADLGELELQDRRFRFTSRSRPGPAAPRSSPRPSP